MPTLLYFAYGSNLLPARLRARVPSARLLAPATLAGYRLRFHKRSADGSGKCNILAAGAEDLTRGAVFEIAAAERPALDRAEFLGRGYEAAEIEVASPRGALRAYTYIAPPRWRDDRLRPYDWYRAFVVAGARACGLPEVYVRHLAAVGARRDPDAERARRNQRLLLWARAAGEA